MHFEATLSGEHLLTNMTLELLDARVRLDMSCQCTLHSKCSKALGTFVGLFMSVDAYVTNQITRFLELLGTICTLMPSHAIDLHKQ